jgi:hypothetical protein
MAAGIFIVNPNLLTQFSLAREMECYPRTSYRRCFIERVPRSRSLPKLSETRRNNPGRSRFDSERLEYRLTHLSTLAAQIIRDDVEYLLASDKVTMLTRVADKGFANVFLAANEAERG